jgi:hypothetical protein
MASKSRLTSSGYGTRRVGSFSGKAVDLGAIFDQWHGIETAKAAIKKAGIPSTTPEWLRTNMEIILGRRGNAIDVPETPELTFSATPTQAECQALFDHVKATNEALQQFKERFDN